MVYYHEVTIKVILNQQQSDLLQTHTHTQSQSNEIVIVIKQKRKHIVLRVIGKTSST